MGRTVYANLFFGFRIEDFSEEEYEVWYYKYGNLKGIKKDDFSCWGDYYKAVLKVTKESGVDFYSEYTGWFIFVKESEIISWWKDPRVINPRILEPKPEWYHQLLHFCDIMELEYKNPQWYLVAYSDY